MLPLPLGVELLVELTSGSGSITRWDGTVCWLNVVGEGVYRAGIEVRNAGAGNAPETASDDEDLYEVLQISAKADFDTVHRVYRMLAQRYHPDNSQTGDEQKFHKLLQAYDILGTPEKRAAYDVRMSVVKRKHWSTFRHQSESDGVGAERRKRTLVMSVMYRKRQRTPGQPYVTLHELEQVLGIEPEHLEFTFWYLREKGLATRTDNGRYMITAAGVEEYEAGEAPHAPSQQNVIEGAVNLPQ
jgi:curved DNA-binding protein CbpA